MSGSAKNYRHEIQTLTDQIHDPSIPLESKTLEDIATVTYEVLLNAPLLGLENSRTEIEALIALKKTLKAHTGLLEQMLAVRMQEALDLVLIVEVARRAAYLKERKIIPPYRVDSVEPETVTTLLKENNIAEQESLHYVRNLNGQFAKFCKGKNFHAKDFLNGEVARAFPQDLRKTMKDIQIMLLLTFKRMDRRTMEDFLFVSILTAIDHAKDVRILCDIFLAGLPASSKIYREQIDQKLALHPHIRISSGLENRSSEVTITASQYIGNLRPKHYPRRLTTFLVPYFSNPEVVAARVEDIYFQYTGKYGVFDGFVFVPGAWLELEE
jgi:hypothetical protein